MRNVPGIWRFTGGVHEEAIVLGERRLVDLPIYHADLLLQGVDARRRKADRYERLRPDHLAQGVPVNAIYVPEDWEDLATEPVSMSDRAAIAAVLDAPDPSRRPVDARREPVAEVSFAEVNRFNTNRPVGEGAYRARIEFVRPVIRMPVGIVREQEVVVENLGDERWPWGADAQPPIRLGCRWLSRATGEAIGEGPRTPFTETVEPGGSSLAKLVVEAPDRARALRARGRRRPRARALVRVCNAARGHGGGPGRRASARAPGRSWVHGTGAAAPRRAGRRAAPVPALVREPRA